MGLALALDARGHLVASGAIVAQSAIFGATVVAANGNRQLDRRGATRGDLRVGSRLAVDHSVRAELLALTLESAGDALLTGRYANSHPSCDFGAPVSTFIASPLQNVFVAKCHLAIGQW